jgi:transposase
VRLSFLTPGADAVTLNPGPLALIAPLLDELQLTPIIDTHLPPDPQLEFSHGKVLSLLVAARLCHPQALIRVPDWAHEHAADLLWGIPADKLNDDRLGRALDAFFEQRHSIMAAVTVRALELAELSLERLHFDTTDVTFCGVYDQSIARELADDGAPFPSDSLLSPAHITKGYLSDRRMLQVGVTSVVDAQGALPVFCHPVDGNRNGHTAIREQYELLQKHLALPAAMQFVSDRGSFSAEHIARLHRHGHSFLGAVPWNDFQALYDQHAAELNWQTASFLSQEQQRRRQQNSTLPQEHYEIAVLNHEIKDPGTRAAIPCRLLFCYSTAAAAEERQRREQNCNRIRAGLDQIAQKLANGHPRTTYTSVVGQLAKLLGKKEAARYFTYELVPLTAAEQAGLPAAKNGHKKPSHRLVYTFDAAAAQAATTYDGLSVLLTTSPPTKSGDTLFTEYKQQAYVELGHHQWKTPLEVRPLFLKSPQRVEALLCLMYLALQAYQMLERSYRHNTPAEAPKAERRMTAEQLLRAFAVAGIIVAQANVGQLLQPGRLNRKQRQILDRLHYPTLRQMLARNIPAVPTA